MKDFFQSFTFLVLRNWIPLSVWRMSRYSGFCVFRSVTISAHLEHTHQNIRTWFYWAWFRTRMESTAVLFAVDGGVFPAGFADEDPMFRFVLRRRSSAFKITKQTNKTNKRVVMHLIRLHGWNVTCLNVKWTSEWKWYRYARAAFNGVASNPTGQK